MTAFSGGDAAVKGVSRETRSPFHVKQRNEPHLLSYAEIAEDDVENVLDVDPPGQPAQGLGGRRSSSATMSSRSEASRQGAVKGVSVAFQAPFGAVPGS